ncbi:DUF1257 domain-containing protein [Bacillus sp. FJAT-49711]|uniref:DUF1257 domain-containing protein n=1 Tax=Bacillus sp. FJAT-49711 TaxID=2833585 RepID=UPI001BC9279D|nr:DUF1257 domain-containing protein [Bacillus sp. FJAT-49711]MBS4218454.1 DUF1257 domain-containing protein [Bacillus sp. FJAT-49711]
MSIELVLIPVGIVVIQAASSLIEKKEGNTYSIQTVMKRQHLLQKAVQQYGCNVSEINENDYLTEVGDIKIFFRQNEKGIFEAIFDESVKKEDAVEFIDNLHTEYKYLIQQETYERLMQQAHEKGLSLESEEIQQDRSILLTFNINQFD